MNLAVRDVSFQDDQGFLDRTTAWSRELLDKPLLRHLMRLMAPTLVVTGAAKRWRTVHQGSELSTELLEDADGRGRARARLKFPERLLPEMFLKSLVGVYGAAVSGARGRDTRVELVSLSSTHAEYGVSWVA